MNAGGQLVGWFGAPYEAASQSLLHTDGPVSSSQVQSVSGTQQVAWVRHNARDRLLIDRCVAATARSAVLVVLVEQLLSILRYCCTYGEIAGDEAPTNASNEQRLIVSLPFPLLSHTGTYTSDHAGLFDPALGRKAELSTLKHERWRLEFVGKGV